MQKKKLDNAAGNSQLALQYEEKEKLATRLLDAYRDLAFEIEEKGKRAAELVLANIELVFQNNEKENRAAELEIANTELLFQNHEKQKRAVELATANNELVFQNREKEKRAFELIIANKELLFQTGEKAKRAAELIIANKELHFQNAEKEKRAKELTIANKELVFQNKEKEKRAEELLIANTKLAYENEEKEKRATELLIANKELEQFAYIASHDLQEPLRTISNYMELFEKDYAEKLDSGAFIHLRNVNGAVKRMSALIKGLLTFARLGRGKMIAHIEINKIIGNVLADIQTLITDSHATIDVGEMPALNLYEIEFAQIFQNLITNAIKFQQKGAKPHIVIRSLQVDTIWQFSVSDNGIGIAPQYYERIFDIFQRLDTDNEYEGYGIGLANCKKIVELHHGRIWLESELNRGTTFYFTISNLPL